MISAPYEKILKLFGNLNKPTKPR